MKFAYGLLAFAFLGNSVQAFASNATIVAAPVDKVFIPEGFDDNDKVEVIVHGHFVSSCYKMGPTSARVDRENHKILISAQAYFYPGAVCAEMMVPFIKSVELGEAIEAGKYEIQVVTSPTLASETLLITHTTRPDADDFLYAMVESAELIRSASKQAELVLKGEHPHLLVGCVKFEDVKISLGASNVLVVQPITRIAPR